MTERETLPDQDLAWPDDPDDPWYGWNDDFPVQRMPPPSGPPWYRSPRLLLTLIGLAAAALVVATALLVTSNFSGEFPDRPGPDTRIPTPVAPVPETLDAPVSGETTPTSIPAPSAEPSTPAQPGAEVAGEPVEPSPSVSAPPPTSRPRNADGPRVNVTRTPMSFTPGSRG